MGLIRSLRGDTGGQVMLAVLTLIAIAVPILNLALPEPHPWHLSTYTVTLLGKYLTYALLAVALDLVWGYLGILSLGHGAFFALGGLFVLVTLFLPQGIAGLSRMLRRRRSAPQEATA